MKWLERAEEFLSYLLFVGGVIVSLIGVFTRYVLNMPQAWVTEIFEFLMVWAIFIGFGMALKDNRHIVVDLVYDKFPFPIKRACSIISNLIGAGYCAFLTITGIKMVALANKQAIVTIDVGIPIWMAYLIMPIGMALLTFYFVVKCLRAIKGDKSEIIGPLAHEEFINESQDKGGFYIS